MCENNKILGHIYNLRKYEQIFCTSFCSFCGRHNDFVYKNRALKKQIVIFAIIKMRFMLARREAKKGKKQKGSEPIFPIKIM